MYLKSLIIKNFRKFGIENNKVEFVDATSFKMINEEKVNIAPITTLIVGKNNSGKTTIVEALEKLINKKEFSVNDFNYSFLKELINKYEKGCFEESPFLEFKLIIGIEDKSGDLVTNLVPFMTLDDVNNSELEILVRYELKDNEIFINDIKNLLEKNKTNCSTKFEKFFELIDSSDFSVTYYNARSDVVKFNINDLIELKLIKANIIKSDKSLTDAFTKIIEYRHKALLDKDDSEKFETLISGINHELTSSISDKHTKSINRSIGKIESPEKLKVHLSSNLTFKKLISSGIKYEYVEQDHNIPENQFGLGYTNLMMIIAELLDYMERYPEQSFNSKVNLISIEEPETFMHPQMQELFIKHINDTVSYLLGSREKNVNSQLIITTHSSHILNSKIHSGNTFDNINYITTENKHSSIVVLNDKKVKPSTGKNDDNNLIFLKKHIKYKVSELFFSDAIIIVEGVTEETLLRYFLDNNPILNKYYISIFKIDGAHGLVYHELIKLLKVPALVITDLDIKRDDDDDGQKEIVQISSLVDKTTTNKTIQKYNNNSDKLSEIPEYFNINNMRIAFQGKINNYYATSFEEAFILTNHENKLLNKVLKDMRPQVYKDIVGKDGDKNKIKDKSFRFQKSLSNSKSEFTNNLLYEFITSSAGAEIPKLPKYILDGLNWFSEKLGGENIQ